MKILYIRRHPRTQDSRSYAAHLYRIRDTFFFNNQDGFFRASLFTFSDVTVSDLGYFQKISKKRLDRYDAVVFHHKCSPRDKKKPLFEILDEEVRPLKASRGDIPWILLLANANAKDIPPDETMDLFDLVFKREHFKNLERYHLSNKNREKLRTTILSCQLVSSNLLNYRRLQASDYGYARPSGEFDCDVYFAGKDTSELRREVVSELVRSDVDFKGGIYKEGVSVPENIQYSRLPQKKFYDQVRATRINLAIEGYGQFTYRHWELWALSAFMISSPSINELKLPFDAVDGEHYVTYEDPVDLVNKIGDYLAHPEMREQIAFNGRELFEKEYDFQKHGKYIYNAIKDVIR